MIIRFQILKLEQKIKKEKNSGILKATEKRKRSRQSFQWYGSSDPEESDRYQNASWNQFFVMLLSCLASSWDSCGPPPLACWATPPPTRLLLPYSPGVLCKVFHRSNHMYELKHFGMVWRRRTREKCCGPRESLISSPFENLQKD